MRFVSLFSSHILFIFLLPSITETMMLAALKQENKALPAVVISDNIKKVCTLVHKIHAIEEKQRVLADKAYINNLPSHDVSSRKATPPQSDNQTISFPLAIINNDEELAEKILTKLISDNLNEPEETLVQKLLALTKEVPSQNMASCVKIMKRFFNQLITQLQSYHDGYIIASPTVPVAAKLKIITNSGFAVLRGESQPFNPVPLVTTLFVYQLTKNKNSLKDSL